MAKECSICGKKLGFLSGKVAVSDGIVCDSCWFAAGLDLSINSMMTSNTRTVNQLRDMIEIEVLKRAAELTGRTDLAAAVPQAEVPAEKTPAVKTTPARKAETTDAKPVDIILEVGKDRKVNFQCAGQPVINLEDLIQGNEMIIGDGFIYNRSKETLPDVRIACEFQPAIVDPGLLYYEEGTFTAGVEGKFEIDDPPVNLEEYAKIKRTRNGKIRFTLFMGEQEVGTAECSMRVKPAPEEEMQKYMKSVMYETEKNASGPVNVFLYARADGTFDEDLMRRPDLLYAMYANGQEQLIGDVYVANETGKKLKNIQFRADFTSDILEPVDVFLGDVPAGENIVFEVDDPAINLRKLEQITEIETCTATYTLTVNGKNSLGGLRPCDDLSVRPVERRTGSAAGLHDAEPSGHHRAPAAGGALDAEGGHEPISGRLSGRCQKGGRDDHGRVQRHKRSRHHLLESAGQLLRTAAGASGGDGDAAEICYLHGHYRALRFLPGILRAPPGPDYGTGSYFCRRMADFQRQMQRTGSFRYGAAAEAHQREGTGGFGMHRHDPGEKPFL